MKKFIVLSLSVFFCFSNLYSQVQLGQNIPGDLGSRFGYSVSIACNGNCVAIGAPGNNSTPGYVEVYQFDYENCEWRIIDTPIRDNEAGALFGSSVSLSKDGARLAIGSPHSMRASGTNNGFGRVVVYNLESNAWVIEETIDGPGIDSWFGSSVFLSGDGNVLAVGAHRAESTGQVFVYRASSGWNLDQDIDIINGVPEHRNFGHSVSLSDNGNRIAIGAINHGGDRGGYFQVYDFLSGAWSPLGSEPIYGNPTHSGDRFGQDIAITSDGNWVAVGSSWFKESQGEDANGKVEIFTINNGIISRRTPSIIGDGNEHLGISVSLSNEADIISMAVGGPYFKQVGDISDLGRARHYLLEPGPELGLNLQPDIMGNQFGGRFGHSVSISSRGNRMAVGSPISNGIGFVQVYDLSGFICGESCCEGENLIVNGDFENGDNDFESSYTPNGDLPNPGQYSVISGTNSNILCANWDIESCFNDQNNSIIVINGQTQQNTNNAIWQTSEGIEVVENNDYTFCFQVYQLPTDCFDIQPQVRIEVRPQGEQWMVVSGWLSVDNTNSDNACDWINVGTTFTADFTRVEIRVILDESGNGDGNDLALDNISLTSCQE